MILKMKLVNIIGVRNEFDRVVSDYIMNSEMELENPFSVFNSTLGFMPYNDMNPYENIMKRFIEVFEYAEIPYKGIKRHHQDFSPEELQEFVEKFGEKAHSLKDRLQSLKNEMDRLKSLEQTLSPIADANVHIDDLVGLKYVVFRFGHMPLDSYKKLGSYLKDLPVYFAVMSIEKEQVWGFYFVSHSNRIKVDEIFSSMYFDRVWIDGDAEGTPAEIIKKIVAKKKELNMEIEKVQKQFDNVIKVQKEQILKAFAGIKYYYDLVTVKRNATYSKSSFYFTGWAPEEEAERLLKMSEKDESVTIVLDSPEVVERVKVPTKIKNLAIFRPFEEFIKMYGVPNYNEIDPTVFLAIIYTLIFGMMFGDVGHGICLAAAGVLMVCLKKGGFLGKMFIPLGLSSVFFGFMYGTFFGFEGERAIIKAMWFTPMENSTNMNRILLTTVGIGVAILMVCMLFNVINGAKQKNWQRIVFSHNGIAGMVFYVLMLYVGITAFMGSKKPLIFAVLGIVISLILIFLQEPFGRLLDEKKKFMPKEKGMFFVQSFFEMFEILLSFITNTISFVRVGAFALNHAGMMSVVLMFMEQTHGTGSIFVAILGNALVIGLEGLIVGIQVLRLGFYEMFSRFYGGDGREFKSISE